MPCPNLKFIDVHLETVNKSRGKDSLEPLYLCANIVDQNATGGNATGIPCNGFAPYNMPNVLYTDHPELKQTPTLNIVVPEAQRDNCLFPTPGVDGCYLYVTALQTPSFVIGGLR